LRVLLVAVETGTSEGLRRASGPDLTFEDDGERPELLDTLHRRVAALDALVVGADAAEPIRMAQRAQSIDRDLAVLILSEPDARSQMAAAVQCAPFLGSAVSCVTTDDLAALVATVAEVALQTTRRRSHREVAARARAKLATANPPLASPGVEEAVYLEQLLDYAPMGVLALGPDGRIQASNRFAQRLLSRRERELAGAELAGFLAAADSRRLDWLVARSASGEARAPAEIVSLQGGDRGARMVEITATSIAERLGRPGIMIVMQDVTDRESARTILELNAELERRIAELDAANRELDAFAYSVSHDLRAPLRAIDGFSSSLLAEQGHLLDPGGRHQLERVLAGARRMSALIDDLLDLSRISRAPLHKASVDLTELARGVIAELGRRDPDRQVEVDIAGDLTAMGDARLVTIVLENLLGNAWKFTARRSGGQIVFGREQRGAEMPFFVRDNGAGFDMKYADRLFSPFQRLHGANEFEGTGIGLATVNRIIARHGGRIWAQAAAGAGATFFFTLGGGQ